MLRLLYKTGSLGRAKAGVLLQTNLLPMLVAAMFITTKQIGVGFKVRVNHCASFVLLLLLNSFRASLSHRLLISWQVLLRLFGLYLL